MLEGKPRAPRFLTDRRSPTRATFFDRRSHYRQMGRPPNSVATAAILNYLRLMLVHETAAADGRPDGLELAHATPRGWLAAGKRIAVSDAPTAFGPASYTLEAVGEDLVRASVKVPPRLAPGDRLSLRVRVPGGRDVTRVTVNGRPHEEVDRATGTIDLTGYSGQLTVTISTEAGGRQK